MEDYLKFVRVNSVITTNYFEGYKYCDPSKHKWLANFMWKMLNKMGALKPHFERVEVLTYGPDEKKIVTEAIHDQLEAWARYGRKYQMDDFALVMGEATFNELVQWNSSNKVPFWVMAGPIEYNTNGYRTEYRGLKVHVVPFFEGMALLPKAIIEKEKVKSDENHGSMYT